MKQYILSDAGILHKIRALQYRHQFLALAFIAVSFIVTVFLEPQGWGKHLTWLLTLSGVMLYLKARFSSRYRNRILQPEPDIFYSPITGKVLDINKQDGFWQIRIRKGRFDPVEIRCPMDGCVWQDFAFRKALKSGNLECRFSAKSIHLVSEAELQAGAVVALITGAALCEISLPETLPLAIQAGDKLAAAETVITS